MSVILEAENVCKTYGNNLVKVTAMDHISLSFEEGEFTAITGRSGSGKSTLLHCLAGLSEPSKGKVIFDGQSVYRMSDKQRTLLRRQKFGIVYQFFNLLPELNVMENILFPVHLDHKETDQAYINSLISFLGFDDKRHCWINELSGGQQQRVAIARALALRPKILFADEPTGNLDRQSSTEVIDLFKRIQKEYGPAIIIVTHDPDIKLRADRNIVLSDGRVIEDRML